MKKLLTLLLALCLNLCFAQKHLVVLLIDDLNDNVGFLGGSNQQYTPGLDFYASQMVNFTNAHVPISPCNPSRCAILTGLRPHYTSIVDNDQNWRDSTVVSGAAVPLDTVSSIFEHFRNSGFRTMSVGKIFHKPFTGDVNDPDSDPQSWDYQANQEVGGSTGGGVDNSAANMIWAATPNGGPNDGGGRCGYRYRNSVDQYGFRYHKLADCYGRRHIETPSGMAGIH